MNDNILYEEIESLKQMLYLACKDLHDITGENILDYMHDLSTRDAYEEGYNYGC